MSHRKTRNHGCAKSPGREYNDPRWCRSAGGPEHRRQVALVAVQHVVAIISQVLECDRLARSEFLVHGRIPDNDGWKDLLIAQAHVLDTVYPQLLRNREPMFFARNTGHGFVDVSAGSGTRFQTPWASRGMAIGDINGDVNNDGKLDALVTTNNGPLYILRSETPAHNHRLLLDLVGHRSNRDAIGAEVTIKTAQGLQFATVTTAGSYLSSSDRRVHFGLGHETSAASIDIRWASGIMQKHANVRANQVLRIHEPLSPTPASYK